VRTACGVISQVGHFAAQQEMADLMAQLRLPINDRTIRRARARAEHCMIFEARGGEPTYLSRALASHSNGRNA
jgi:hypothetical protein